MTEPKGCHNCGRDPKKEACGDFCNGFHSAWIPQAKPLTLTDLRREAAKWRDHPECVPGSHLDEVVGLLQGAVAQLADANRRLDRIDAIVEDALRDIAPKLDAIKAAVLSATPDPDDNKDKGACIDSQYPDGRTLAGTG